MNDSNTQKPGRSVAELAAELETVLTDREATANAAQWEMVSLRLLQECAEALRACALTSVDKYWLARGRLIDLKRRADQGEDNDALQDDVLAEMDTCWLALSPEEVAQVRTRSDALRF